MAVIIVYSSEQRSLNDYNQKRIACTAAKVEVVSMKQQDCTSEKDFRNPFLFNI